MIEDEGGNREEIDAQAVVKEVGGAWSIGCVESCCDGYQCGAVKRKRDKQEVV